MQRGQWGLGIGFTRKPIQMFIVKQNGTHTVHVETRSIVPPKTDSSGLLISRIIARAIAKGRDQVINDSWCIGLKYLHIFFFVPSAGCTRLRFVS